MLWWVLLVPNKWDLDTWSTEWYAHMYAQCQLIYQNFWFSRPFLLWVHIVTYHTCACPACTSNQPGLINSASVSKTIYMHLICQLHTSNVLWKLFTRVPSCYWDRWAVGTVQAMWPGVKMWNRSYKFNRDQYNERVDIEWVQYMPNMTWLHFKWELSAQIIIGSPWLWWVAVVMASHMSFGKISKAVL